MSDYETNFTAVKHDATMLAESNLYAGTQQTLIWTVNRQQRGPLTHSHDKACPNEIPTLKYKGRLSPFITCQDKHCLAKSMQARPTNLWHKVGSTPLPRMSLYAVSFQFTFTETKRAKSVPAWQCTYAQSELHEDNVCQGWGRKKWVALTEPWPQPH